jgi:hypothetical protein
MNPNLLIRNINKLDTYIQDKIYNYFWERQYYQHIVMNLRDTKLKLNKLILFMRRYILHNPHFNIINYKYELFQHNILLRQICNNRGMILYLQEDFPVLKRLIINQNIEIALKVSHRYRLIFIYSMLHSGPMRYSIYERFTRIDI